MPPKAPSLARSVQECIGSAEIPPRGRALGVLARHYAEQIDAATAAGDAKTLADLGPKLQSALVALGLAVVLPAAGKVDAQLGKTTLTVDVKAGQHVLPADMLAHLRAARERRTG